ncbi:hypothetical protein HDU93_003703 [Gonapodya sp. JEL0774]|nr:hypothetical protein HDU93_003703 [Gonapodya sp. JEL0774]
MLLDPHINLINVFDSTQQPYLHRTVSDPDEAQIPRLFYQTAVPRSGLAIVDRHEDFSRNFSTFSERLLEKLDWRNVFAAGGSVATCLMPQPLNVNLYDYYRTNPVYKDSDVDLFLYDLTPAEATAKVKEIAKVILGYADSKKRETGDERSFVVRTQHAITFVCPYPFRRIQIVLRIYKSPAEVLMGFDIDSCCAGYDGNSVWILPRCARALTMGYNLVDLTRRSPSYEYRLYKYSRRGFSVAIPGFQRDRVAEGVLDPKARKIHWDGKAQLMVDSHKGLALLLRLDLYTEEYNDGLAKRPVDPEKLIYARDNTKGQTPPAPIEAVSDYDNVKLPQGEKWTMRRLRRFVRNIVDNADSPFRKSRQGIPKDEEVVPLLSGSADHVLGGTIRNIGPKGQYVKIVPPAEMWLTENPGVQLTGSFNPISEPAEKWFETAYRAK